ncbi:hypothetical protein FB561_0041 [Kribbella amoyensis]|uniref:DUF3137 domain-containing protein n=1 Tax=Kribbella amoyensis TaxID=996641 RepID=A0A561BJF9_9ACTN|nr:hypothetical protein [Kribbella amoyensis]TWD78993.1 hypothetical protein FB561_0041 [Kribbella amoyensis]
MFAPALLLGLVPFALFVAGLIALVVVQFRRREQFMQQRAREAARCGWYPAAPNPWLIQAAIDLWRNGKPGQMLAGDFHGRGMCVLDYSYTTTSSGANGQVTTTTHHVHLVALNLPVALPPMTVTADSKVKRFFGGRDLELESKAFNDAFRITCLDDRFASAVLHPRMMEWLLYNPGLEWQFAGNALISWGSGLFVIQDVYARLEAMSGLADRIPPFVLRDYGRPVF